MLQIKNNLSFFTKNRIVLYELIFWVLLTLSILIYFELYLLVTVQLLSLLIFLFKDVTSSRKLIYCRSIALAPISEEILFRFWLLLYCKTPFEWMSGIIISSLLFSLFHFPPWFILSRKEKNRNPVLSKRFIKNGIGQCITSFIIGLVFGFLLYLTKSIYVTIVFHFLWNYCVTLDKQNPLNKPSQYLVKSLTYILKM